MKGDILRRYIYNGVLLFIIIALLLLDRFECILTNVDSNDTFLWSVIYYIGHKLPLQGCYEQHSQAISSLRLWNSGPAYGIPDSLWWCELEGVVIIVYLYGEYTTFVPSEKRLLWFVVQAEKASEFFPADHPLYDYYYYWLYGLTRSEIELIHIDSPSSAWSVMFFCCISVYVLSIPHVTLSFYSLSSSCDKVPISLSLFCFFFFVTFRRYSSSLGASN